MAGNRNSGRHPTPSGVLKLTGQHRQDRHGDRGLEMKPKGKPACPTWLDGESRECWESVVPQLVEIGVATKLDENQLAAMCRWWAAWRDADRDMDVDPSPRNVSRAVRMWQQFQSISARFGMTPADRIKLSVAQVEETPTEEARFFG